MLSTDPPAIAAPSEPRVENPEAVKTAGRGGLAIAVAKISFVLFGFAQQLALPAILGTDGYGIISRVLAIVGIVNNVVVALSIQGVSRTVSSTTAGDVDQAYRRVLWMHAALAVAVSTGFALLSGSIAEAVKAPYIALPLRIIGVVVFLYGVYAPLVGSLNGQRRFMAQAGLDILYGGLRLITTIGFAFVFSRILKADGVEGGVIGFALGALLIVPIALTRAGTGKSGGSTPSVGAYFTFLGPLALGLIALNVLLQTDFLSYSRFIGERAMGGADLTVGAPASTLMSASASLPGLGPVIAASNADVAAAVTSALWAKRTDELVGVYRAFQLFSFLPYQLLMSVTFVLFPMLARAQAEGDREAIRRYTRTGMRLAFILIGLIAGIVAALPYPLLRFAFKDPMIAEVGQRAQPIHALGMAAFALLGVVSTALTSLRRERAAALLTVAAVALVFGACSLLVPRAEFGEPMMIASATATLGAMVIIAFVGGVVLSRAANGFVPIATPFRVALAMACALALGHFLPFFGRLTALIEAIPAALVYLAVLLISGELGRADLALVRGVLGRKSPP